CQRCVNLYPEQDESGDEKDHEVAALIGTSGLKLLASVGTGPIRGSYVAQNGVMYVVSGSQLFKIGSDWVSTEVRAFANSLFGTGPVSMADNGVNLFIVDQPNGFTLGLQPANTVQTYADNSADPNWQGSTMVVCADGYFVFNVPDSFEFYCTNLLSTTINPLGLASRET